MFGTTFILIWSRSQMQRKIGREFNMNVVDVFGFGKKIFFAFWRQPIAKIKNNFSNYKNQIIMAFKSMRMLVELMQESFSTSSEDTMMELNQHCYSSFRSGTWDKILHRYFRSHISQFYYFTRSPSFWYTVHGNARLYATKCKGEAIWNE